MSPQNAPTIRSLVNAYLAGRRTPEAVIGEIYQRIGQYADYNIWIHLQPQEAVLAQLEAQKKALLQGAHLPLFGVPFAVKDNIDVAALPTTAACPEYTYVPTQTAEAVQRLLAAGALLIGKTNMDQFATGLVGTRSPYGAVKNAFDPAYISGGSSSGSAVAVALGLAAFSLGTDTAGSGRIPAGFNNLVGLKPTGGMISTKGVVPACRSLDCVSVFAHTTEDAALVYRVCTGEKEPAPPTVRQPARIGFPQEAQLYFEEGTGYKALFASACKRLGARFPVTTVDFDSFSQTAQLLYHGPWVAERMAAIEPFFQQQAASMNPVVRSIIAQADQYSATDTFRALAQLDRLKEQAAAIFEKIDLLVVPTAPGIFTIEQVAEQPVERNTRLGYYTNYVNLLGLCALALPAGFNDAGLPFGITLIAPGGRDQQLLRLANDLQEALAASGPSALPAPPFTEVAVAGLHKRHQPLAWQLTSLEAAYRYTTTTSPRYRMYLLDKDGKRKPGLVRQEAGAPGCSIEVEIWYLPTDRLGAFLNLVPHPLGLGRVELADGSFVTGFICESYAAAGADDISEWGSWEAFLASGADRKEPALA
ncbi:allophanate hydrolase [Paraflavisolibacter sp. H34]|uniref:allophanate hydrolase n=1 Tax=Huijunlia imazamoxiresistens TaxID=3127457 RepID=UPI003015EACB